MIECGRAGHVTVKTLGFFRSSSSLSSVQLQLPFYIQQGFFGTGLLMWLFLNIGGMVKRATSGWSGYCKDFGSLPVYRTSHSPIHLQLPFSNGQWSLGADLLIRLFPSARGDDSAGFVLFVRGCKVF